MKLTVHKKRILYSSIAVLIVLALCTYLSRTVWRMLLPVAETVSVQAGTLDTGIDADTAEFTYTGLWNITAGGDWPVTKVLVSQGKKVRAGDALLQVDVSKLKLETEHLQASLLQLEEQATGGGSSALTAQIQIARQELDDQQAGYPADGIVKAPSDGTVWGCDAFEGRTVQAGKTALSLVTKDSVPSVQWTLSSQAGTAYQNMTATVTVQYLSDSTVGSDSATIYVADRTFDDSTDKWTFTAPLKLKVTPSKGDLVRVHMVDQQKSYQQVIPTSCVRTGGGGYYVLAVAQRQGYFSEESYLTRIPVDVLAKNDMYAAVAVNNGANIQSGMQVVQYSSKAVQEGDVVTVRNTQ